MKSAKKFKSHQVPRQKGERARLKVVSGPDQGSVYVVFGAQATIGRGEEADIFIGDLRASRTHARIDQAGKGWTVKDLDSANGILLNGKRAKSSPIQIGDTVSLGDTILEFVSAEMGTLLLMAPARSLDQLQMERKNYREQVQKIQGLGTLEGLGEHKKTWVMILGGAGLGLFLLFSPEPSAPVATAKKKANSSDQKNLAMFLPQIENDEMKKASERFYREGVREYLLRNYGRAQSMFQTTLQVNPGHSQAKLYLEITRAAINEEAAKTVTLARRALDLGRSREAENFFENILRLYQRDQTAPQYIEASDQLKKLREARMPASKGGNTL